MASWENASIKIEKTSQAHDMELDIETLTQLVTGYITPAQATYRKGVAIHSKMEELSALFPLKTLYLMEHF